LGFTPKYYINDVALQHSIGEPCMYLVVVAWLYVALMMAVAEANHPLGTLLGACVTFVLYGVGPVALLIYLMGRSGRRAARQAREAAASAAQPDGGSEAAADAVAAVREKA
jgi:hypothetical protein